jgi:hypothetical protein
VIGQKEKISTRNKPSTNLALETEQIEEVLEVV